MLDLFIFNTSFSTKLNWMGETYFKKQLFPEMKKAKKNIYQRRFLSNQPLLHGIFLLPLNLVP